MSTDVTEQFPMPDNKLILVDLDKTLIDTNYEITDPGVFEAIQDAQADGWTVGLSSDTPYEALALWRERFGMNGPIIAEKGAVVAADDSPEYDREEAAIYAGARNDIVQRLGDLGIPFWLGNPVEALRDGLRLGAAGETVVLLNNLRQCSLSFSVRRVDEDGALRNDPEATQAMDEVLRDTYPAFDDLTLDVNPAYGIVIASRDRYNKRTGTQRLLAAMGLTGKVAMIGDSMGDFVGPDVAVQYAVSNASQEYADKAAYRASQPIASGVVEILRRLIRPA